MLNFILRRLGWTVVTVFGVMIVTFLLFRTMAGDIAASNLGQRATEKDKATWRHRYGYDKPTLLNLHRQLVIRDLTHGPSPFMTADPRNSGSLATGAMGFVIVGAEDREGEASPEALPGSSEVRGRYVYRLDRQTPISELAGNLPLAATIASEERPKPILAMQLSNGKVFKFDLSNTKTAGDLIDLLNNWPENKGQFQAGISERTRWQAFDSQFFHHLLNSMTFQARSFKDNRKLTDIIAEKGPYSLSIMIPAEAFGFLLGLAVSLLVAYYRGKPVDKTGVFLSVLGMCVPFLAFMIYGQWLMFEIAPKHAFGIFYRANIYLPVAIMVIGGLGGTVRFYRTIILDETNRDYVRTARAKGLPLPSVLFKHVLKNCMLPILTNLILAIPFLIMGSLLVETYFGIPGLGDLMLTSINDRNEPILSGLVFLTALVYSLGVLITDLSYAVFDPRIRLS